MRANTYVCDRSVTVQGKFCLRYLFTLFVTHVVKKEVEKKKRGRERKRKENCAVVGISQLLFLFCCWGVVGVTMTMKPWPKGRLPVQYGDARHGVIMKLNEVMGD